MACRLPLLTVSALPTISIKIPDSKITVYDTPYPLIKMRVSSKDTPLSQGRLSIRDYKRPFRMGAYNL